MKKVFITLGVVFVVLLVLGAIGFVYLVYSGSNLDKESKAYVDAAIPAIVTNWNKKELFDRASPEFKKAATDAQIDQLFRQCSALGRFMTFDSATGQSLTYASPQTGKIVTANYQARAYFEKGGAMINVKLIKHGDQWQISAFNVMSPRLDALGNDEALEKESKAYADAAIHAIVPDWNEKEFVDRASPEFNQAVNRQQLDQLFHKVRQLGHLKKCDPPEGHAGTMVTAQTGKQIGAEYYAKATFDKGGAAVIDVTLIKHGDQWQILGFYVKPPEFASKPPK